MKTSLIAAVGAFGLAAVAFSGGAQAQTQCWWNGYSWSCPAPQANYYQQPYYGSPYPAFQSYPGYGDQTPYMNNPSKPDWLPSYPGPKPSGGAGR